MPRARVNLAPHRLWITTCVAAGLLHERIVEQLNEAGLAVSVATLRRNLSDWGVRSRRPKCEDSEWLRGRIAHAFYITRTTDEETSQELEEDGFPINPQRIAKIRKDMGLYKQVSAADLPLAQELMEAILKHELDLGEVENFGKNFLYTKMRSKYNIVSRDRMWSVLKELNPEGVRRRLTKTKEHKGAVMLPGPNWAWSMDAYCKLEYFGFQVYAAVDVYARHIVWIYIGITGRTQVSVWYQYVLSAAHGKVM